MGRLVLRRLGATVPVLLLVTAGVFSLIHLTPGDPIDAMMAESVDATVKETSAARARARPADPRAVRGLDGAAAARRPRPLDPQRRAGHRERRPAHPPEPRAGRARHDHLAGGRRSRSASSPPIRRNTPDRPRRHHVRAVRHLHAELPAGPAADLRVRRHAALAADLRLHGSARGAAGAGSARWSLPADHAGAGAGRGGHAHAALEHARGAHRGLRAHRAGQGALGVGGDPRPRAARTR